MGHDISGFNKAGTEIAYSRFSMGNSNAIILYRVFDALDYYAGVSGNGHSSTFSKQQVEKALENLGQLFRVDCTSQENFESMPWDVQQIFDFIINCLGTAQIEGSVKVYFG